MRIIDDKGRLFGKINIIDALVILFVLCLMPMFYFGYKIFNRAQPKEEEEMVTITKAEYDKLINPPPPPKEETGEPWTWFTPNGNHTMKINGQ